MSRSTDPSEPTRAIALLQTADFGHLPPLAELVPLVYDELHRMAHWQLGGSRATTLSRAASAGYASPAISVREVIGTLACSSSPVALPSQN